MHAYFVQHGLALASDIDPSRPLSDPGRAETNHIATWLQQRNIPVREIFHSGKLRAEQTAQIFAGVLQVASINRVDGLNPNDDPQHAIDLLRQPDCMLVGHLPNIQRVVNRLITGNAQQPVIRFRNSAVACVGVSADGNLLEWFITPDLCA